MIPKQDGDTIGLFSHYELIRPLEDLPSCLEMVPCAARFGNRYFAGAKEGNQKTQRTRLIREGGVVLGSLPRLTGKVSVSELNHHSTDSTKANSSPFLPHIEHADTLD